VSDPEEQFDTFVCIAEQYLQPASPQEVNISSQMQTEIAYLQDRGIFLGLDGASRRNILHPPRKEVVQMLEDNLLTKFKQSPEVKKLREDQERKILRECISPSECNCAFVDEKDLPRLTLKVERLVSSPRA